MLLYQDEESASFIYSDSAQCPLCLGNLGKSRCGVKGEVKAKTEQYHRQTVSKGQVLLDNRQGGICASVGTVLNSSSNQK
jgi:hypothetical protein